MTSITLAYHGTLLMCDLTAVFRPRTYIKWWYLVLDMTSPMLCNR